ncbi:Queuine tRNA-ribosyltransferase [Seminavis robusta]|uniref:Queuine tRNA-ribosyltransferase n=1 Tax=Seminavis robusta TaxID=568900 RepID=A0A9N8HRN3_9STRA|nr:Queuine tRNA-ribosyltransferase [Seminavis robusta]|eukprot:Sro1596_g284770.1 Queuine tRNA-ribosyltransferase (550) ;mRNA; r:7555-9204
MGGNEEEKAEGPVPKKQRVEEPHDFSRLPDELKNVDFSRPIRWGKCFPYISDNDNTPAPPVSTVPVDTPPVFDDSSPALCHYIHAVSGRARACTIHLKPHKGQTTRPVPTPIFMPVGTKGCLKGLSMHELTTDPALSCPIILANTYHMALQPGTELLDEFGGLHCFMGNNINNETSKEYNFNLLTDSGGFQMVSLAKLSQVTEEGVTFENPFLHPQKGDHGKRYYGKKNSTTTTIQDEAPTDDTNVSEEDNNNKDKRMMLLKPEDSIRYQNEIGANIIMALDDVVSSVEVDADRFEMATYRTLRWYDRCLQAHQKSHCQNLFPIVQGGLDTSPGGLRERCLAGFRRRELDGIANAPGYAIGGLAGGESKDDFWRVVDQCCKALPDNKPRYLMGVGYPLDLVVCSALGVDMYDCVYPTRTARFGVALVPGPTPGTLRLKSHDCATDHNVLQEGCPCQACAGVHKVSRARLHRLLKTEHPLAIQLLTQHNIAYMMSLVRQMRQAILQDKFDAFARDFVHDQFRGGAEKNNSGGQDIPVWVREALAAAGIDV